MSKAITFHHQKRCNVYIARDLKQELIYIFNQEKCTFHHLSIILCDDEFLLNINKSQLNHNYYTDTITFNYSNTPIIDGEIYISVDRVKENAFNLCLTMKHEFHRVLFHSVLHLCGYDDASTIQRSAMSAKEDVYLTHYIQQ